MILSVNNVNAIPYRIFFIIVFLLYISDLIVAIGVSPLKIQKAYIAGVPLSDISLFLLLIFALLRVQFIYKICNTVFLTLVIFLGIIYLMLGLYNVGLSEFNRLNEDIRSFLWFFGGISLSHLLIRTHAVQIYLISILMILSTIIAISSLASVDTYVAAGLSLDRVTHPNIYNASGMMYVPLIMLMFLRNKSAMAALFILGVIFLYIYYTGYVAATRSQLIIGVALLLIYYVSNSYYYGKLHRQRLMKMGARNFIAPLIAVSSLVVVLLLLGGSQVERLFSLSIFTILSGSRALEIVDFFQSTSLFQFILGRGFGGGIPSYIALHNNHNSGVATVMHVGIFNFWMKFGVLPFLIMAYMLYVYGPRRLFQSFRRLLFNQLDHLHFSRIIFICSLVPWALSLLMSGGFGSTNFMMLGFSYYLYRFTKVYGYDIILNDSRRREYNRINRNARTVSE